MRTSVQGGGAQDGSGGSGRASWAFLLPSRPPGRRRVDSAVHPGAAERLILSVVCSVFNSRGGTPLNTKQAHDPTGGRMLELLERLGNRLPDPATFFLGGTLVIMLVSAVAAATGWEVTADQLQAANKTIEFPRRHASRRAAARHRRRSGPERGADDVPGEEPSDERRPVLGDLEHGRQLHGVPAAGHRARDDARHRHRGAYRPDGGRSEEDDAGCARQPPRPGGGLHRHHVVDVERRRLRRAAAAGRRHLLCGRPVAARRSGGGVRRRFRWLLGKPPPDLPRPAAGRVHESGSRSHRARATRSAPPPTTTSWSSRRSWSRSSAGA